MTAAEKAAAYLERSHAALSTVADRLRELTARCPGCRGAGSFVTHYVAYVLTDDARVLELRHVRKFAARRRARPMVDPRPCGTGVVVAPCLECHELRQVVEIAEAAL